MLIPLIITTSTEFLQKWLRIIHINAYYLIEQFIFYFFEGNNVFNVVVLYDDDDDDDDDDLFLKK